MRVRIDNWAAWSPGLETQDAWRTWATSPEPLGCEGVPEVKFLPPAIRRRSTGLTKMMVRAGFDCCGATLRSDVRTVFASRHGAIDIAVKILANIVTDEPVSPTQFSHSVHNTQAGLYSIAAANRQASSSLAAEADTFASAFLEALLHLERAPQTPVLVIVGDEPLPEKLLPLVDEPAAAYAAALLLSADDTGIEFRLNSSDTAPEALTPLAWPQAIEFIRWWASQSREDLSLGARRCYEFSPAADNRPGSAA